jgi:GNAT superfamily N-acetyltransferase
VEKEILQDKPQGVNPIPGFGQITTDKRLIKLEQIHQWLAEKAYWSEGIAFNVVKNSFDHSFCMGIIEGGRQLGYARLITDYATFAYLLDVYVVDDYQGKGLGKLMMNYLFNLDWVRGLRRINLKTRDAQSLYARYGFKPPEFPERYMSRPRLLEPWPGLFAVVADPAATKISIHFKAGNNNYLVTTNKAEMKTGDIYQWLSQNAYWCKNIPLDKFTKAFENTFCIGILHGDKQVAFARLVTDYTMFAYLADVYVEESHRGLGLSKEMLKILLDLDWVKRLGLMLITRGAQGLYEKFGFAIPAPERIMELTRPNIYNDTGF